MKIFFSAENLSFYPDEFRVDYENSNSWPSDALEVTLDEFMIFGMGDIPEGKKRGSHLGRPAWVDMPATIEDLSAVEIRFVSDEIERIRGEIEIASDYGADPSVIDRWVEYRKLLRAWPKSKDFPKAELRPAAPDAQGIAS